MEMPPKSTLKYGKLVNWKKGGKIFQMYLEVCDNLKLCSLVGWMIFKNTPTCSLSVSSLERC